MSLHEKYFLAGAINHPRSNKPHNTIVDNFTMYNSKDEAMTRADQLLESDKNLIEVRVCFISAVKTKITSTETTD